MLQIRPGVNPVREVSTSIASRSGTYLHLMASTHVEPVIDFSLRNLKEPISRTYRHLFC
jgi:hypothetical protein